MAYPEKILIVGCGYVGAVVARLLKARGSRVVGWVRSEETAAHRRAEGLEVITGEVGQPYNWNAVPTDFDAVVHCAASGHGGADDYAAVYREGLRQIIQHLPKARTVFTSSTSVYAQTDGEIVTELSEADPVTETGKILCETEELGLNYGATILRFAGIYGPGRGALIARLKRGEAVIEGDGLRWLNQIHRDDAAAAVVHALGLATSGEIYNVSDNEPVTLLLFYQWACEHLNLPLPPVGPANLSRKRGVTNKRVSNAKLRATGWEPQFSTFREGYNDWQG